MKKKLPRIVLSKGRWIVYTIETRVFWEFGAPNPLRRGSWLNARAVEFAQCLNRERSARLT